MGPLGIAIVGGLVVAAGTGAYTLIQTQSKIKNDCDAIVALCDAASTSRPDIVGKISGKEIVSNWGVYVKESRGWYTLYLDGGKKLANLQLFFSTTWGYWAEIASGVPNGKGQWAMSEPYEVDCKEFRATLVKEIGALANRLAAGNGSAYA
jgi:hypothetical protein